MPRPYLGVRPSTSRSGAGPERVVFAGGVLRQQAGFRDAVALRIAGLLPGVSCALPRSREPWVQRGSRGGRHGR